MRKQRAYVILVIISAMLSAAAVLISVNQSDKNDRKFCDIVTATISKAVPKPSDPKSNPSREQNYEWYQRFVVLHNRLGC